MPNPFFILFVAFVVSVAIGWLVYINLQRTHLNTKGIVVKPRHQTTPRESSISTGKSGVLSLGTSEPQTRKVQEILVSNRNRQRGCPTCERRYPETFVLCPHDGVQLVALDEHVKRVRIAEGVGFATCEECGRHYNADAKFCRRDGKGLKKGLEHAVRIEVCEACGAESSHSLTQCCESARTYWVDPSSSAFTLPVFPMLICPMCHSVHPPGAGLSCEEDHAPLQPLIRLEHVTLAPLGVGPRRKICGYCGRRYSRSAHFCAMDGGSLNVLN